MVMYYVEIRLVLMYFYLVQKYVCNSISFILRSEKQSHQLPIVTKKWSNAKIKLEISQVSIVHMYTDYDFYFLHYTNTLTYKGWLIE